MTFQIYSRISCQSNAISKNKENMNLMAIQKKIVLRILRYNVKLTLQIFTSMFGEYAEVQITRIQLNINFLIKKVYVTFFH